MTSPHDPTADRQGQEGFSGGPASDPGGAGGYGAAGGGYAAPGGARAGAPTPPDAQYGASYGAPTAFGAGAGYGAASAYGAPVSPDGRPELASWGLRLGGYLVDVVILSVITAVVWAVLGETLANLTQVVLYYGVFGYLTGTSGQTPGRKVVGIRVVREADGQVLGAGMGIVRNICHILDALPLLLGFFWPLWDAKNQTFADKIVKSVVVKG